MVKASQVNTANVTSSQIDKCHLFYDGQVGYYHVESENDAVTLYEVRYGSQGFTCSCEAGKRGFSGCKSGYCKHVAWSVAHANERKATARAIEIAEKVAAEKAEKAAQSWLAMCAKQDADPEIARIMKLDRMYYGRRYRY